MKALIAIVLCAAFSATYGLNDTDLVYAFVNCSLRAAANGIEGLIPSHDPLHIQDFNVTQTLFATDFHLELTNNILYNLMDLELKQVDVTSYTNPGAVDIQYDIYWLLLNFTGNYAWSADVFGQQVEGNGTYQIRLHDTDFAGLFNLTKPGQEDQGIVEHLDDFTLKITVKGVGVTVSGIAWLTGEIIETILLIVLNSIPDSVADFIKEARFNDFWIAHPERIDAILDWCTTNPS